ncbi:MAG: hypothetical protein II469_00205 [Firmicutes bacterium]|nr:hypothetical protein [Bacillota bacterium]MBQ2147465.1 hypothetical protein [Bacillota bacterium]
MRHFRKILPALLLILSAGGYSYADIAPLPEPQEAGINFIPILFLIALIVAAALIIRAILRKRK